MAQVAPPTAVEPFGACRADRLEPRQQRFSEYAPQRRAAEKEGAVEPSPTDRGKSGTKRHQVVDREGIPLAVTLSGANVHDGKRLLETVHAAGPVLGKRRRARKCPAKLHADKAYDDAGL